LTKKTREIQRLILTHYQSGSHSIPKYIFHYKHFDYTTGKYIVVTEPIIQNKNTIMC